MNKSELHGGSTAPKEAEIKLQQWMNLFYETSVISFGHYDMLQKQVPLHNF
jgi:hypothetical protein